VFTLLHYLSSIAFILTELIKTYGHAVYIYLNRNLSRLSVIKITTILQGHVTILLPVSAALK
jgi:hypothetical protein